MNMTHYRKQAAAALYNELVNEQAATQQQIRDNKRTIDYLDGIVRPRLQTQIKTIGAAIEANRNGAKDQTVEFALIQQVRETNNQRHDNRVMIKNLAEEQKHLKARLDVLGQIFSVIR